MSIAKTLFIENFTQSIEAKQKALSALETPVTAAATTITNAFKNGNKLLICGNGGSAADSQHFAAEFTGRYEMERTPLPAIALTTDTSALTAIGNDYSFDVVFSKQVEALGNRGDILFAISTSGNSGNVIKAIEIAQKKGMIIIAMTGKDGGKIDKMLGATDINICAPANRTARIQEIHLLVLHTICDIIDNVLFK
ncbi:MAG: phosphoheptose isomerase [Burkholderiales bacterium]|jgi:D-sedoheptulose 7-phosphate isomerase|nr:phosphoheptose isomerase [Burkholderiales bacterium]